VPVVYLIGAFLFLANTLYSQPKESIAGLAILAVGVPVYIGSGGGAGRNPRERGGARPLCTRHARPQRGVLLAARAEPPRADPIAA